MRKVEDKTDRKLSERLRVKEALFAQTRRELIALNKLRQIEGRSEREGLHARSKRQI